MALVVEGVGLVPPEDEGPLASLFPPRQEGRTRTDAASAAKQTAVLPDIPLESPPAAALPQPVRLLLRRLNRRLPPQTGRGDLNRGSVLKLDDYKSAVWSRKSDNPSSRAGPKALG